MTERINRGWRCFVNWNNYLDCLFSTCDNFAKTLYTFEHYKIPGSTFHYYFTIISDSNILIELYGEFIKSSPSILSDEYQTLTQESLWIDYGDWDTMTMKERESKFL